MYFERFFDKGLAQASYLIGCQQTGEALVVDPLRDVDRYLDAAQREGLRITHVTETHIHADFLSGARQLAAGSGAQLLISDEGGEDWLPRYDHTPLHDGDRIQLGRVSIETLHTPGHTPEHVSFVVTDTAAGNEPVMVLTGDFLFVGDVGRPDLLENAAGVAGSAETSARRLFSSTRRIRRLPEFVQVWPGHGAGSACGKALGALPSTTVGYELRFNWALREESEERFVRSVLSGQPEVPDYFGRMKLTNRDGVPAFDVEARAVKLDALSKSVGSEAQIVDTRSVESFSRGHSAGALNIPDDGSFVTWAGWLLDPNRPVVLVARRERVEELRLALGRVGVDEVRGYVEDPGDLASVSGPMETIPLVSAMEYARSRDDHPGTLIDVRSTDEYAAGHIPGARHIHLGDLRDAARNFGPDQALTVYCESGGRSGIAASLLRGLGMNNVTNLSGGFAAYRCLDGAEVERSEERVPG